MSFLLAAVLLAQAPALDDKKIQELVEKCGAEAIAEREAAVKELMAMGDPVLPALEKAIKGTITPEAKAGVQKVIDELMLPARWVKDVVEGDWNQVYQRLDASLRNKELDKPQAVRVFSAILLNDNVTADQRQAVLQIASNQRLREVWPAVIQLMNKEDPYQNYYHYLQHLRPPKEAAIPLLKMIPKMQNSSLAWQMLDLARNLKADRAPFEECLTGIIEGDDINLKNNALSWLQQGRLNVSFPTLLRWWRNQPGLRAYQLKEAVLRTPPGDGVNDVIELLRSNQPDDVQLAVDYVGRQRIMAAAGGVAKALDDRPELRVSILQTLRTLRCEDELRKWISTGSGPGRRAGLALAAELGWISAGPDVVKALSHEEPAVRREAAIAAGALKVSDSAAKLEELLKDGDGGVRRAALVSLALVQKGAATKIVLAHVTSEDPDLQAAAVESLPSIDAEQALAALTTPEALGRAITRHALAVLIVKGGAGMLHRVMARVQGKITPDELHSQIRLIQSVPARYGFAPGFQGDPSQFR